MSSEWKVRKILYVHSGKRFLSSDGTIYGYDQDILISLKKRYLYLGADVKFVQFGVPLLKDKTADLINLYENGIEVIPVKYCLTPWTYKFRKETKKKIFEVVQQSDIVIARMPSLLAYFAQEAAIKYGIPYIVEVVACPWDSLWNYSKATKLYAPFAFFKCKRCVAKSDYTLYVTNEFLQKRYPNSKKTCAISDVILKESSGETLEKKISLLEKEKNKFIITTLAAIDVLYKGQHFVIKAIAQLKKKGYIFEYHLAGTGNPKRLMDVARKFGVNDHVVFEGMINSDQVIELLDKTDIYVQPSLLEGLPRAIVEAMSRGCVVIGTNAGGIPELIGENYIFSRGNVKAIESLLYKLVNNKELLIECSNYNFEKSKLFNNITLNNRRNQFYDLFIAKNF